MQAHALELALLAVELEASLGGIGDGAHANLVALLIDDSSTVQQLQLHRVQIWRLRRPKMRILQDETASDNAVLLDTCWRGFCNKRTIGIVE